MVHVSRRAGVTGSTLVSLLAQLTDLEVPASSEALADRLSRWLGWTDAVSLSTALNGGPAKAAVGQPAERASPGDDAGAVERVRSALAKSVVEDGPFATTNMVPSDGRGDARTHVRKPPAAMAEDFATYRRHYVFSQQAMELGIAPLRTRLRAKLAARSADMARLAAVDAVMEQALGPHERSLLSTVPVLLEKHFARSRPESLATPPDDSPAPAWLQGFRQDMQTVLLAELDIRMQPVEGLLEALRIQ
jgi:hypothetical protein